MVSCIIISQGLIQIITGIWIIISAIIWWKYVDLVDVDKPDASLITWGLFTITLCGFGVAIFSVCVGILLIIFKIIALLPCIKIV
jgi:hypothetical protein